MSTGSLTPPKSAQAPGTELELARRQTALWVRSRLLAALLTVGSLLFGFQEWMGPSRWLLIIGFWSLFLAWFNSRSALNRTICERASFWPHGRNFEAAPVSARLRRLRSDYLAAFAAGHCHNPHDPIRLASARRSVSLLAFFNRAPRHTGQELHEGSFEI